MYLDVGCEMNMRVDVMIIELVEIGQDGDDLFNH